MAKFEGQQQQNVPVVSAQPVVAQPVPAQPSFGQQGQVPVYAPDQTNPIGLQQQQQPPNQLQEQQAAQFLRGQNFPEGLIQLMIEDLRRTCYRIFIIDDSGSMAASDGCKMQVVGTKAVKIKTTRWKEQAEAVKFHGAFAHHANSPTEFRLLNSGAPVIIGQGVDSHDHLLILNSLLDGSPGGMTPLCRHISEVVARVQSMEHQLRANNQHISLTVFTDGRASDGDVSRALKPLEHMPVRTVVRLCTDDDNIVNYWNSVDDNWELQLDCLDDLFGENEEVTSKNRWLTYATPLHRLREFGCHLKEFDLLDECHLNDSQIRTVISRILGGGEDSYPHPSVDKGRFVKFVKEKLNQTQFVMCPKKLKLRPWIRVEKMGGEGCTIS